MPGLIYKKSQPQNQTKTKPENKPTNHQKVIESQRPFFLKWGWIGSYTLNEVFEEEIQ